MNTDRSLSPLRESSALRGLPTVTPDARRRSDEDTFASPTSVRIERSPPRGKTDEESRENRGDDKDEKSTLEDKTIMMYSPRTVTELPTIKTGQWPYTGKSPSPISIHKARKLLAAAYATVPCEINGTGVHGHAWIIEKDEEWTARKGTSPVDIPQQPVKPTDYSYQAQRTYDNAMDVYKLYIHLVQQGKDKLIEWFGEAMFLDLYEDELLPNHETPKSMMKHLEDTYSQGTDHRRLMDAVRTQFEAPYDQTQPVEVYFKQLQEARTNAKLLGEPFTDKQAMNRALREFERHYEKEAYKAEKKWNERTKPNDKTWAKFKQYWKEEIHQWEVLNAKVKRQANSASKAHVDALTARLDDMELNMEALQSENRSYKERNEALVAEQIEFRQALQAEHQQRGLQDDISALTLRSYMAGMNAQSPPGGNNFNNGSGSIQGTYQQPNGYTNRTGYGSTSEADRTAKLLQNAQKRAPDAYRESNEGRGRKFNKYCWKCGCNCTHWTRRCYELTKDQKARYYRDANFDNTMGGSTHNLDRRGKWQADFNFDSL